MLGNLPQNMLDPAGPVARIQANLLNLTLWIAIAIGVGVAGALLYIIVRFRQRKGDQGLPRQVEGNPRLEVVWTLIPILILVVMAVPTARAFFQLAETERADALEIRAEAVQWFWNFTYPDAGVTTSNELRIPVGRPVRIVLTSRDVIHSLWVPRLGGKTDLIPGRTNVMWLEASEPGVYAGQCAELCGTAHANMRFRVIAEPAADFEAWLASRQNPVVAPEGELAQQGYALFETKGCAGCHTVNGTTYQGTFGPNLSDVGGRLTIAAGLLDNTDENLRTWLADPAQVKPGAKMPNLGLTAEEIDALVAFLRGLK